MIFKKIDNILGYKDSTKDGIFFTTNRAILYTRILALSGLSIFLSLIKSIIDQGLGPIPMAVFILFLVVLTSIILNKAGMGKTSRVLFLLLMNVIIALLCSVVPKDRFGFIFFFALIIMAFVIFEDHESTLRDAFIVLSSAIVIALVLTDFKLFWDFQLPTKELSQKNFIINVMVTILIITLCLNYLIETNKKSQDTLRNQASDIEKKNNELQKINAELDRFVYSASHDLRAPLLSIQGLTTVALAEAVNENEKKYFNLIHERIIKLDEFVKEIIEYSRNSRTELLIEKFRTEKLINHVIEDLKYLKDAQQVSFTVSTSVKEMLADKRRVGIILANIVGNAVKYYNPRSNKPFVKISVDQEGEHYVLKIEDNGMGISEEAKARIFEMFYRATEKSSGSGLGLYIVKEIVHRLGGSICVESTLRKGSLFVVKIPVGKTE